MSSPLDESDFVDSDFTPIDPEAHEPTCLTHLEAFGLLID